MIDFKDVRDEPLEVHGEDGNVALFGPCGSVVLSPEAAEETSDRLWKLAMTARRHQKRADSTD
jgi:hypothetical protein